MPDSLMERVMSVFNDVDEDDDGWLDKDELISMLSRIGVQEERAGALFDAADHDDSGSVDFEEFCTWLFSDARDVMSVSVKKGEVVDKHLKMEVCVGDVICYGLGQGACSIQCDRLLQPGQDAPEEPLLEMVCEEDSEGSQVFKFKALQPGTTSLKVCLTVNDEVQEHDFTVTIEMPPVSDKKKKPKWYAWSWYEVKWVKVRAKKATKFAKKMRQAAEELKWVPGVYQPKKKKLHVQDTFCFSPKML